ncbi:hypothetical protein [Streptomyces sp. G1]|uniref:hypothetical protein n=1 Tax=Streptomyces sp. G1 TaxID=361572 RepID=UPI00202F0C1B|nr:hypothetical protein [Streptomyces sp. G1]MCM1968892.1 hypothetical protein [Streptomyces sp. G1]
MRWAEDGLITRQRPVPDADTPHQQAFEAQLLAGLAGAAVLGLTGIRPAPVEPSLTLHPDRSREVLDAVLPRLSEDGALHGVPGLRLVSDGGSWWLTRTACQSRVRLVHPQPGWAPSLPPTGPAAGGPEQLWRSHRHGLHPAEVARLHGRADGGETSRDRDRLLSRMLRRLRLITEAAAEHGRVHLETTQWYDLVIMCCCGSGAAKLMHGLRRSALGEGWSGDSGAAGDIDLGEASVAVRHGPCRFQEPADTPDPGRATC